MRLSRAGITGACMDAQRRQIRQAKRDIRKRTEGNLERVRNLVRIYEGINAGQQGRRAACETDILRAAVVLLHACLEDFVRTLQYWRLPTAGAVALNEIPMKGLPRPGKVQLGDVAQFRGQSVDDLVRSSVEEHLSRSNYNNCDDITRAMDAIDVHLDEGLCRRTFPAIEEMIRRRHQIVHRADRNEIGGSGNHRVSSLGREKVNEWIEAVETFAASVISAA